mmetsp:Transcript_48607/g.155546  ORF Transcript_48607/g.155546 Transcript_48607/m.155546 type:complete len:302 (-) Transcript_48607:1187-2092(-)
MDGNTRLLSRSMAHLARKKESMDIPDCFSRAVMTLSDPSVLRLLTVVSTPMVTPLKRVSVGTSWYSQSLPVIAPTMIPAASMMAQSNAWLLVSVWKNCTRARRRNTVNWFSRERVRRSPRRSAARAFLRRFASRSLPDLVRMSSWLFDLVKSPPPSAKSSSSSSASARTLYLRSAYSRVAQSTNSVSSSSPELSASSTSSRSLASSAEVGTPRSIRNGCSSLASMAPLSSLSTCFHSRRMRSIMSLGRRICFESLVNSASWTLCLFSSHSGKSSVGSNGSESVARVALPAMMSRMKSAGLA